MNAKPDPNHDVRIATLRRMSPEERLAKSFELTEASRQLFREGLRRRYPDLPEHEFQQLYVERLTRCPNSAY